MPMERMASTPGTASDAVDNHRAFARRSPNATATTSEPSPTMRDPKKMIDQSVAMGASRGAQRTEGPRAA